MPETMESLARKLLNNWYSMARSYVYERSTCIDLDLADLEKTHDEFLRAIEKAKTHG